MIIKGNSAGYPLPDPRKGLEMQGGMNMNGQALKGLNAPVANDEAANKGYVDANKVDKSNVVNNFTTTEAGFVADARTAKVLNDKIENVSWITSADGNMRYKKIGNTVFLSIKTIDGKKGQWTTIGTLPVGYRPNDNIVCTFAVGTMLDTVGACMIQYDGTVQEWCQNMAIQKSGSFNVHAVY